jgi:hypothetical protein
MTAAASVASPAPPQVLLAHHLRRLKLPTFLREYEKVASQQAFLTFRKGEAALAQRQERGMQGILKPLDTMLLELHQLKARAQHSETSTWSLLFGSEDVGSGHSLREIYSRIKEKHDSADAVYFDLWVEKLAEARLKDGDLEVFGVLQVTVNRLCYGTWRTAKSTNTGGTWPFSPQRCRTTPAEACSPSCTPTTKRNTRRHPSSHTTPGNPAL